MIRAHRLEGVGAVDKRCGRAVDAAFGIAEDAIKEENLGTYEGGHMRKVK